MNDKEEHETFVDPVCGMTVSPNDPYRASHGGEKYLFCSARCRERFIENPEQFLQAKPPGSGPNQLPLQRSTSVQWIQII